MSVNECAVLFSGGTDSTCAAALCAEKYSHIHLLTFFEKSTEDSPLPLENFKKLSHFFGADIFSLYSVSVDKMVEALSFQNYFSMVIKHGFFMLATPGFSSLSWHLRTIAFCKEKGIRHVHDGMTQELMHLPGHSAPFRKLITALYAEHGITFSSPVYDWPVPPDQRMMDRLIVDRHGFASSPEVQPQARTTGLYLYEKGILPHPNVKGSQFDQRMQHDCYPFVVFNVFVFWFYLAWNDLSSYSLRIENLFSDVIDDTKSWFLKSKFDLIEPVTLHALKDCL